MVDCLSGVNSDLLLSISADKELQHNRLTFA